LEPFWDYETVFPATLKKRADFLALKSGKRFRGPFFLMSAALNTAGEARVGYTVTKKQGNAVQRNRMKRRLKALVQLETEHFATNMDYVLVADASLLNAPHEALRAEMANRIQAASRLSTTKINRALPHGK
jgi:ribonuclease P protein component